MQSKSSYMTARDSAAPWPAAPARTLLARRA